jgi:glycosyltransferase involved in cell wall biosynthesis
MTDSMPVPRKARIVVAGQLPPPVNGQNIMIARILAEFRRCPSVECEHLVFKFTPHARDMRRGSFKKIVELIRVIGRLLALRARGPIDLLLFPAGGPQTVPVIRDCLLLPWILLCARRVVVQFHAGGIAERMKRGGLLCALLRKLYGRCDGAVVMTPFNRRDPEALGIGRIDLIPHRLPDEFDASLVRKDPECLRLLCIGHLCPEKGTPELLGAFKYVADRTPGVMLELAGECLPPLSEELLRTLIRELGLEGKVEWRGVVTGQAKRELFGRADVLVFPSVAPFETFGLVMIEAMMWGLPIVATDWRGNRDVLGADFEGICQPIDKNLADSIAEALASAITTLRTGTKWSGRNRQLFLDRYRYDEAALEYPHHAERWLRGGT